MPPKKAGGVSPKWPFQRSTWNGSQPRPSTAIVFPGPPKSIAGSLLPVELAFGWVVSPAGGDQVEISSWFENDGAAAAAVASTAAASAKNVSDNAHLKLVRMSPPSPEVGASIAFYACSFKPRAIGGGQRRLTALHRGIPEATEAPRWVCSSARPCSRIFRAALALVCFERTNGYI